MDEELLEFGFENGFVSAKLYSFCKEFDLFCYMCRDDPRTMGILLGFDARQRASLRSALKNMNLQNLMAKYGKEIAETLDKPWLEIKSKLKG